MFYRKYKSKDSKEIEDRLYFITEKHVFVFGIDDLGGGWKLPKWDIQYSVERANMNLFFPVSFKNSEESDCKCSNLEKSKDYPRDQFGC